MTKKEWLDIKSHSIGGSEVAAILGLNPYKTKIDVYLDKVEGNKTEENIPMRAGTILEPLVADLYAEESGNQIIIPENKIYFHKDFKFLVGSPDRFYANADGTGILECKTSGVNYDNIPEFWTLQLIWYLGIIGHEFGAVAWLKNNREFKYSEFGFVQELFDSMVAEAVNFWNKNVLQQRPPEITEENKSETIKIFRSHEIGKKFLSNPDVNSKLISLARIKEIIKVVEAKEKDLSDTIKMIMEDSEAIINDDDKILCTYKKDKDSQSFDLKKFKEENPELYQKYLVQKIGPRKLLVKTKEVLPANLISYDKTKIQRFIGGETEAGEDIDNENI